MTATTTFQTTAPTSQEVDLLQEAHELAHELLAAAARRGLTPREMLQVMTMAQCVLHRTYPGQTADAYDAIGEATATFVAHATLLAPN